jgi:hypothetical protein
MTKERGRRAQCVEAADQLRARSGGLPKLPQEHAIP